MRRLKYYEDQKPDLILIDGGRTQLNFTNKILKNFGMEKILVLGIAKGKGRVRATETIYTNNTHKINYNNRCCLNFLDNIECKQNYINCNRFIIYIK